MGIYETWYNNSLPASFSKESQKVVERLEYLRSVILTEHILAKKSVAKKRYGESCFNFYNDFGTVKVFSEERLSEDSVDICGLFFSTIVKDVNDIESEVLKEFSKAIKHYKLSESYDFIIELYNVFVKENYSIQKYLKIGEQQHLEKHKSDKNDKWTDRFTLPAYFRLDTHFFKFPDNWYQNTEGYEEEKEDFSLGELEYYPIDFFDDYQWCYDFPYDEFFDEKYGLNLL